MITCCVRGSGSIGGGWGRDERDRKLSVFLAADDGLAELESWCESRLMMNEHRKKN